MNSIDPKSDISTGKNWNLDWQNMLATCNGGESDARVEMPLPANLSCDAYKNYLVETGKISPDVEQNMITPLLMPASPSLFKLDKGTGYLEADASACAQASIDASKLNNTVKILNLNCERLARQRREIVINIDRNKKILRKKQYHPDEMPDLLIQRYFQTPWPEFFTTIRCCLGQSAEDYLQSVNYNG